MKPEILYAIATVFSSAICIALGAMFGALGQGKAIAAAMEGIARQPESFGDIRSSMIVGLAFIESLVIYCLVISFILLFVDPLGIMAAAKAAAIAVAPVVAPAVGH